MRNVFYLVVGLLLLLLYFFLMPQHLDNPNIETNKLRIDLSENEADEVDSLQLTYTSSSINHEDTPPTQIDNYKIYFEGKELKVKENYDIKFVKDSVLTIKSQSDKYFFESLRDPRSRTQNGRFYMWSNKILNENLNAISLNQCNFREHDCGTEIGIEFYPLEDGSGFLILCSEEYIRIDQMDSNLFNNKKSNYWQIDNGVEFQFVYTSIGLTQDGKYLYVIYEGKPETIKKYAIGKRKLLWERKIEQEKPTIITCISPDNSIILASDFSIYDEDFNKIKKLPITGAIDRSKSLPKFINYNDKVFLIIQTKDAIWITDCSNKIEVKTKKISFQNIKRVDFNFVNFEKLFFKIELQNGKSKFLYVTLENINQVYLVDEGLNVNIIGDNNLNTIEGENYTFYKLKDGSF